jgi:hypothetical protein
MSTNGQQQKKNGKSNGYSASEPHVIDTPDRAYARGFRECYGLLTVVVHELPTEARLKYIDKLQDLYERVRLAEKRAGEGP